MNDIDLALIAERGILEKQAVLLCESVRRFAGKYAGLSITVISPRVDRRPSGATLARLSELGVNYLPLDITSAIPEYGTTFRMYAAAEFERLSSAEKILFVDSDLLFAGEPDLELHGHDVLARPVDVKGMCTTGAGDPNDIYWRNLCKLCDVDYADIPSAQTTVDKINVMASYNGGFVLAKRSAGVFARTLDYFKRSVAADIAPFRGSGLRVRAAHGLVTERGSEFWGSSQACLSLAVWGSRLSVRNPDLSHNFPLHKFDSLPHEEQSVPLKVIHYHHLFDEDDHRNPLLNGEANVSPDFVEWLQQARLAPADVGLDDTFIEPATDLNEHRTVVVVLGMHRSGTSAITRALQAIGVALGDKLAPGVIDENDKGFFEDTDITRFNIKLMESIDSEWDSLYFPLDVSPDRPALSQFIAPAMQLLRRKLQRHEVFGFKDPRMSRLLPFWQRVFAQAGVSARYVVAYRNPASVVLSLRKRNKMDLSKGYYLWLIHQIEGMRACVGEPYIVVNYDLLMERPREQLERLKRWLGFTSLDETAVESYSEFLSPDLRHAQHSETFLSQAEAVPVEVIALNNILLRLSQIDDVTDDIRLADDLDGLCRRLRDLAPALQLLSRFDSDRKRLERQLHEANAHLVNEELLHTQRLTDHTQQYESQVAEHRQQYEKQIAEYKERYEQQLMEYRQQFEQQLKEYKQQFEQQLEEYERQHTQQISQHTQQYERQFAQYAQQHAQQIMQMETERNYVNTVLAKVLHSNSWKLTRPLRALRQLLGSYKAK